MFAQHTLIAEMGRLQKFALRLTKNRSDAEDLVQSTCLRALEKSEYFQDGTNMFGWTSKIMFNLFATTHRRKAKFETRFDPEIHLEKQVVAPTQEINAELMNVRRAMAKLSDVHQEVLVLACVQGMQYDEISKMLKIPVGTVRSRLSRAREQLQLILSTPHKPFAAPVALSKYTANQNMPHIPAHIASWAMQRGA